MWTEKKIWKDFSLDRAFGVVKSKEVKSFFAILILNLWSYQLSKNGENIDQTQAYFSTIDWWNLIGLVIEPGTPSTKM